MKLVIDVTPVAVNRTAVYHIVIDTVEYLTDKYDCTLRLLNWEFQSGGRDWIAKVPEPKLVSAENRVRSLVKKGRTNRLQLKRDSNSGMVFYFDPLYTVFHRDLDHGLVMLHDLTPVTMPQWHDQEVAKAYEMAFSRLARSRASFVCNSESTARDLWVNYGLGGDDVTVTPLYLRRMGRIVGETWGDRENLKHPYLLFVGGLEKRKNVDRLLDAYTVARIADRGIDLMLIGSKGYGGDEIEERIDKTRGAMYKGYRTDQELKAAYEGCFAFVYPSMWEGFGLPLLEAMSYGKPCLVADNSAIMEVAGGRGIEVDPCRVESIAVGLLRLVSMDARARWHHGTEAKKRAMEFSFARYCQALDVAIEKKAPALVKKPAGPVRLAAPRRSGTVEPTAVRALARRKNWVTRLVPKPWLYTYDSPIVARDSFSSEYYYLVQQGARRQFVWEFARLSAASFWKWPLCALQAARSYLRLVLTTLMVRSLVNERNLKESVIEDADRGR